MLKEKTELNIDVLHRELVLCSGQGRGGGLRIVSNGVRPTVLETFRDFNISACWTLRNTMRNEEEEKEEQHNHHKILVLRNVNENNDKEELLHLKFSQRSCVV